MHMCVFAYTVVAPSLVPSNHSQPCIFILFTPSAPYRPQYGWGPSSDSRCLLRRSLTYPRYFCHSIHRWGRSCTVTVMYGTVLYTSLLYSTLLYNTLLHAILLYYLILSCPIPTCPALSCLSLSCFVKICPVISPSVYLSSQLQWRLPWKYTVTRNYKIRISDIYVYLFSLWQVMRISAASSQKKCSLREVCGSGTSMTLYRISVNSYCRYIMITPYIGKQLL